ncbi:Na+/H+ antiporter [Serinicoccus hydrothermalis]|uniref:Na+/H+ antiporter n=1 Tax=Serinicoccus hydrothermalis TaxID=1758689 RepID=A0A1B1N8J0_9MICO|nr:cation:proton antiporter [Serinicoccus hydrothermalis]ANS77734.1 Na+/H+ antiporter [Serinicoccus hydrothermalis]
MTSDLVFLLGGAVLLVAVALPSLLTRAWLSAPVILIVVGALVGLLPVGSQFAFDPTNQRETIEHVTEFTVLVALMGVGLALDRPLSWRNRASWRTWKATWTLLGIAMPLTIAGVFLLGWWGLGLGAAQALLLGAVLSPTDPVLASDVQVAGPATRHRGEDERDEDGDDVLAEELGEDEIVDDDEVRFALTSEAGLNDALAFPFVYAAIFLATLGPVTAWGWRWLAWDLVGRIVIGLVVGLAVGWLLAHVAFRSRRQVLRLAEQGEALLALAAMLLAYGVAEVAQGYGFLAVFVCAMTIRSQARRHEFHEHMHGVIERLERVLTLVVLLFVGIALTDGALEDLDWRGVLVGVALVAVVRPVSGWVALAVGRWRLADEAHRPLAGRERAITAFFGIRGVGTLYYLAYALSEASWTGERWLWSTCVFTVVLSVVVHGVLVTPVMTRLERDRERLSARP